MEKNHTHKDENQHYKEVGDENVKSHSQDENLKLKSELEEALAKYSKCEEEMVQYKEQLLRMAAEAENVRKRLTKQAEDAGKFAINNFAKDLTEVIENLYLATNNVSDEAMAQDENLANLFKGVEMTKNTLLSVFDKYGVKRIFPEIKEYFDHNFHQAVAQVVNPEFEENMIVSVMRAGYVLHDRLIKPAMVVVAKKNDVV